MDPQGLPESEPGRRCGDGWEARHPVRLFPPTAGVVRLAKFGLVGLSGLVVNTAVLVFSTEVLGIFYLLSALLATQGSTLWNFGLSEVWVFAHRRSQRPRRLRLALFLLMNNAAFALRGPMMVALTAILGLPYLVSNLVSVFTVMLLRFVVADRIIWARKRFAPARRTSTTQAPG
jgi:dolichol-phosphate mannosyltransferase